MAHLSKGSRQLRSKLARATHDPSISPADLAELKQQFHASALADYLEDRLSVAPRLESGQYDALHAVIRRHRLAKTAQA